ncbi:hypothetical protein SLS60_007262 [Paraconiothyrium brasiliense]|uniref:Uncharacterized protein n=1 Tax=Paraconiothyrium brasiliense TaxID=300254 RepID=A0ABR3R5N7_9PLEO
MLAVDDTIPLPAALDDTQPLENENESHTTDVPSVLEAFNISVKIFQVLDEARNMNGEAINKSFGLSELAETLQLNEKLDAIERNLPAHLKPNKSMSEDTPRARMFKLQAESVMLRILNVRSILLRPPVLAAARMSFSSPSATETVSSAETTLRHTVSALSVATAVSAISMLHDNLQSPYRIMSSSVVFMVLSAATLIIAASLVPEFEVSIEPSTKYRDTITMAFEVLEGHQWQIENARGARKQLESFIDIVKQTAKHRIRGASAMPASHDDASLAPNPFEHSDVDLNDPLWNVQWFDTSFWPLPPVP